MNEAVPSPMFSDNFSVRIEVLENGYTVTVPDMEERAKKKAEAKAKKQEYAPYLGDCTETYVCKTIEEAMKYVKAALNEIPSEYETAFKEATEKRK